MISQMRPLEGSEKTAKAHWALLWLLWEAVRAEMDAHAAEIAEVQKQPTAKRTELLELFAKM